MLITYEYLGGIRKYYTHYWSEPFKVVEEKDYKKEIKTNREDIVNLKDKIKKQCSSDEYHNKQSSGVKKMNKRIDAADQKASHPLSNIFGGKK